MSIIRKPNYPDSNISCNNRNIHEYTPYIIDNNKNGIIDKKFYESLTPYCRFMISQRTNNNFMVDDVVIPHDFQFDNENKFLSIMYKCYIDSFDYNIWYQHLVDNNITNIPEGIRMFKINDDLKKLFADMYDNNMQINNVMDNIHIQNLINNIAKDIDDGVKYFIRMSSTSGKNEKYVREFDNAFDIVAHIASVKLFVDQEFKRMNKESYLILMPWNSVIEPRYEFRIFVVNNKLVAVSQQNSKELYAYSSKELKRIEKALGNISFIVNGLYDTYVGDVYVDGDVCKLIEINPFGASSGAGAALFNWVTDYNLLHGLSENDNIEFRYLSIINY